MSSEAVAVMSTAPATVAPAVGKVRLTVGGVVSEMPPVTVTETVAEVAVLPAASEARAFSTWVPLVDAALFHEYAYGDAVLVPTRVLSMKNSTLETPTLSEAVAVTCTVPLTLAPLAGAERLTVGAVESELSSPNHFAAYQVEQMPASRM